jgi:hypothetical protein
MGLQRPLVPDGGAGDNRAQRRLIFSWGDRRIAGVLMFVRSESTPPTAPLAVVFDGAHLLTHHPAIEAIESHLADEVAVSPAVVHRRLEYDDHIQPKPEPI